jgi:hypothetical protein
MANSDHHALIEKVYTWAREHLRTDSHIPFMVFTIDEKGQEGRFAADPACFSGGDSRREDLAQMMRKRFRKTGIVCYAIAAECWVTRQAPPAGPFRQPQIRQHGGREEVVIVHVCDRGRATLHISTILRDPRTGDATGLIEIVTTDNKESMLDGRFTNLLEGRVY